jgi:transcription antitermination factor NusG
MGISTAEQWDSVSEALPASRVQLGFAPAVHILAGETRWYAIQIRAQFEKKVDWQLRRKGIETFLPLLRQVHQWSDRRKLVEIPLFAGYAFVRLQLSREMRLRVLETPGVLGFVGFQQGATPIPASQIDGLRRLLESETNCTIRPFLRNGQRVRIHGGALEGVEGILQENGKNLVISIECIQRSIAIKIQGYDLETV